MKNKLIALTQKLSDAGFQVEGFEYTASDLVRITFENSDLELIVNDTSAQVNDDECDQEKIKQFKKILSKYYTIEEEVKPAEIDIFTKLKNAA
ncbi:MAG: hypothetical protein U9O98_05080 [Asgard group archaeon]|nr:hypothetical protein [Asgard group archaeon]